MKLKVYEYVKKGGYSEQKEKYIDVGFWSFMKCQLLTSLALSGIVFVVCFIIGFMIGIGGLI